MELQFTMKSLQNSLFLLGPHRFMWQNDSGFPTGTRYYMEKNAPVAYFFKNITFLFHYASLCCSYLLIASCLPPATHSSSAVHYLSLCCSLFPCPTYLPLKSAFPQQLIHHQLSPIPLCCSLFPCPTYLPLKSAFPQQPIHHQLSPIPLSLLLLILLSYLPPKSAYPQQPIHHQLSPIPLFIVPYPPFPTYLLSSHPCLQSLSSLPEYFYTLFLLTV